MKTTNQYVISFSGLKLGKHRFEYKIDNAFFDSYSYHDFEDCEVAVEAILDKKSTFMELAFKHKGTVKVPCDLTNEVFDLPIKGKINLVIKFGEEFNNDNEEMLILPHGEHQMDIAQYLYEMIVLSVPQKRVHPGVKEGTLGAEAMEQLSKLSATEPKVKETKQENTDPRWDKLKQLLTDK